MENMKRDYKIYTEEDLHKGAILGRTQNCSCPLVD